MSAATGPATARVPFVRAHGEPFEAGLRHGRALAGPLRAFLDDGLARLDRVLAAPQTLGDLRPTLAAYDAEITKAAPALAEELRGLAEGAELTYDEVLLLQLRREIMGYSRIPTRGDCTTYARSAGVANSSASGSASSAAPVLAQTVDLNGDLDDQLAVLEIARPGTDRRALILSFGGLLGYLGLNSDGLAVGLNLVLGGQWRPGLPPYLAIRHLLDEAGSVAEALDILRTLRLASSRSLTLCDADQAVWVEFVEDEIRVVAAPETVHTNHFLHPDFTSRDELNPFARNSSVLRLKTCQAGLETLPPDAGPEEHLALMATAPICVADNGDIRRERTVAAVVMYPTRGELHLRPGDPSLSQTQSFQLETP